jgi:hypothetical protein
MRKRKKKLTKKTEQYKDAELQISNVNFSFIFKSYYLDRGFAFSQDPGQAPQITERLTVHIKRQPSMFEKDIQ